MAADLEAAGNANDIDKIMADTDAAIQLYSHYRDILAPLFPEKKNTGAKNPIDKETLLGIFDEMTQAMNDLDMDKMEELLGKLENYQLEGEGDKFYKRLCDAAGEMDPDACDEIITKWKDIL
jgi:hypothetical protein